ncbi:TetR/AcrR family transcriptional regulator [Actinocrispum wychmicini]|uniref:TetR family transcriptional regulator n=1 Tax=Actinocrispum wychmicini TaxID=1213861 RepID=A0A4R2JQ77_9PSEU|nr:TetR/AcrR family transcriptional regulator [Actinocrispum wychmicini]TCO62371.1 TetR family transcriptional regulator [Actinocrispum wychmicini]
MTTTVERISQAALKILLEEGAQAVTMRRVAAASGVTAMASYRHFPNREALLRAVVDEAVADVTQEWGKDLGADFGAQVDALLEQFLDFALGMSNLYLFLVAEQWDGARQFPEDFRTGGSPAFAPMLGVVEEAMINGVLKADDPLEVTLAVTSPVMGLVQQYLGRRIALAEKDFRALCQRTVQRVLNGLAA